MLRRQTLMTYVPTSVGALLLIATVTARLAADHASSTVTVPIEDPTGKAHEKAEKRVSGSRKLMPDDKDGAAQEPMFGIATGTVLDPSGAPAADARISIKGRDHLGRPVLRIGEQSGQDDDTRLQSLLPIGELGVTEGPVPPITAAISGDVPTPFAPWLTQANGEFTAGGLPAGRYRVYVSHHAHAPVVSDEFVLLKGASHTLPTPLRLNHSGHIQVRVLDLEGNPASHAVVSLASDDLPLPWTSATDEQGSATFNNLAGTISIEADVGEETLHEQINVQPGRSVEVVLRLTGIHSDARLAGTVVDKLGHVVEDAEVRTSGPNPEHQQNRRTSEAGKFSFSGFSTATIHVTARHPSGGSVTKTLDYDAKFGLLNVVMHLPETAFPIEPSRTDAGIARSVPPTLAGSLPTKSDAKPSTDEAREGVAIEVERRGKGVVIAWVAPGSRAQKAGLRTGQFVLRVDGVDILVPSQARSALRGKVGTRARLRIRSGSGPKTLRVPRENFRLPR